MKTKSPAKLDSIPRIFSFAYLLSYVLVLLIPISMSGVLNNLALRLAEDYAENASLTRLEQASRMLDQRMLEFDGIVRQWPQILP